MVDIISEATGLTKVETETVISGFLEKMKEALRQGERIEFRGFGSFSVKKRKPKKARNPGTGETIYLPERYVPVFKASDILKDEVNSTLSEAENEQ